MRQAGAADNKESGEDSPLVQRGLVLNESTGKTIKIGGPTYNRLMLGGHQFDRHKGTLTPPQQNKVLLEPQAGLHCVVFLLGIGLVMPCACSISYVQVD